MFRLIGGVALDLEEADTHGGGLRHFTVSGGHRPGAVVERIVSDVRDLVGDREVGRVIAFVERPDTLPSGTLRRQYPDVWRWQVDLTL